MKLENIKSGEKTTLTVFPNQLVVELEIDPDDQASHDDKYTLYCHNDESTYKKTLTVKDDKIEGDEFISLKFENIKSNNNYSLEINPGSDGEPYLLFEDIPLDTLLAGKYQHEGSGEAPSDQEIEQIYDDSQDSDLPYDDVDTDDEEYYDEEIDLNEVENDENDEEGIDLDDFEDDFDEEED
jgi:hypothetical protein